MNCIPNKILILIIFFTGISSVVKSQQLLLSPSPIDNITLGYEKVIGQDEDGYFVLMSNMSLNSESDRVGFKSRKYKITYFNKNLTLKWDKTIETSNSQTGIEAVTFFNDKVVVTSSVYSKSEDKMSYYISCFDNNGDVKSVEHPVAEFTGIKNGYIKSKIILSQGRTKMAIIRTESTPEETQTVNAAVFDTSFSNAEIKKTDIPFSEKNFEMTGSSLSDNNDLVLLGYNSEKIKARQRKSQYYVYSSKNGQNTFKDFKVSGEKTITGIGVAFDNLNNKAVLAGFFADNESSSGAGIFYASIDLTTNDELKVKTSSIDSQKNKQLTGERNVNAGLSIIGYPIERIVLRNDGGAVIVAEAAYTTDYSYYDSFSQSFTRRIEYHFENVVVLSINSDGTMDWNAVIDKEQISLDDDGIFSSFCSLLNSEHFIILYNEDISKHNTVIPAAIDNKGLMNKGKPINGSEGLLLLPRSGKQVSENSILVPAYKKRSQYLVLFTF